MKTLLAVLFVLLTCVASPIQAAEPASAATSAKTDPRHLPDNYLFTFTLERPKKDPLVISLLNSRAMTEFTQYSPIDPLLSVLLQPTLKENERILVDYSIGFRVKIDGDKFLDEGVKGSVYLTLGKEITILQDASRTIKLKIALPGAL